MDSNINNDASNDGDANISHNNNAIDEVNNEDNKNINEYPDDNSVSTNDRDDSDVGNAANSNHVDNLWKNNNDTDSTNVDDADNDAN